MKFFQYFIYLSLLIYSTSALSFDRNWLKSHELYPISLNQAKELKRAKKKSALFSKKSKEALSIKEDLVKTIDRLIQTPQDESEQLNLIFNRALNLKLKRKTLLSLFKYLHLTKEIDSTVLKSLNTYLDNFLKPHKKREVLRLYDYALKSKEVKNYYLSNRNEDIINYSNQVELIHPGCKKPEINRVLPIIESKSISIKTKKYLLSNKSKLSLNRRDYLYNTFSSEEIKALAFSLLKSARRFEADCMLFTIDQDVSILGDEEYIVLSPMGKYKAARALLRRDFLLLKEQFKTQGKLITYDDLVISALETGVITFSELDKMISFEEFWNPKVEKWRKWVSFSTSLVQTATLVLAPPFNFIAATGIGFLNSKFIKSKETKNKGDSYEIFL